MVRVTSVGCFLLVIVFLNLIVPTTTSDCIPEGSHCGISSDCCKSTCCMETCEDPCRYTWKRAKLQELFRQR
uniref:I2_Vc11.9 prepropeptide n=1 Tax=Conus victoriae TaxID=319920 RepID=W4VSB4_CONVC